LTRFVLFVFHFPGTGRVRVAPKVWVEWLEVGDDDFEIDERTN
jgi:hypothetical protein